MTLHNYLLFLFASLVLVLVPGPDMVYLLGRCIAQGRRAGMLAALGFNLGGYAHLTAAALGLSAILATSAFAFNVVKWLGAGYLIYVGFGMLRRNQRPLVISSRQWSQGGRSLFWQAFLTDVLNPKVAMFFLAFLPQFVEAKGAHPMLQIILLGVTVNMMALLTNILLVYFSTRLTQALRRNTSISGFLQKGLGAIFIALGLRLAVEKA